MSLSTLETSIWSLLYWICLSWMLSKCCQNAWKSTEIDELIEHGGLLHVLPLAVHLIILNVLTLWVFCGTTPSCPKDMVGGCVVGGLQHISVSPWDQLIGFRTYWDLVGFGLGLGGFRTMGLGPGLDILTIYFYFFGLWLFLGGVSSHSSWWMPIRYETASSAIQ